MWNIIILTIKIIINIWMIIKIYKIYLYIFLKLFDV